jgi:formamidopyrimidine-DNA glycosylase
LVFDRKHEDCYHCGGEIERIEVSSRRIYLCQACQPRLTKSATGGSQ